VCRKPNSAFVMKFLGDANRLGALVVNGVATVDGASITAPGVPDGPAEILTRPGDLGWTSAGKGISATIARVIDRPDGRRLLARTDLSETLELDVPASLNVSAGERGVVQVLHGNVFPAG